MNSTAKHKENVVVDVTGQLAELQRMTVGQLRERYLELYGVPTNSRNKQYLQKKLAFRVQELAEGGLSDRAKKRIDELNGEGDSTLEAFDFKPQRPLAPLPAPANAKKTKRKPRDPRLPEPGTTLTRSYKDTEHQVSVLEDGFEYGGEHFTSLSKIARKITGTSWNGYLFFGLVQRKR